MRIRTFRPQDLTTLYEIQQTAARVDGIMPISEEDFAVMLEQPALEASANVFVATDDDDELMNWGQAGTLEGIEGEIMGYTILQLRQDEQGYHLLCQGTVQPSYRRQHGGRALLICALNRARILASEFEFEAEQEGIPVYFEALLPTSDPGVAGLAARCEMISVNTPLINGLQLYRRTL